MKKAIAIFGLLFLACATQDNISEKQEEENKQDKIKEAKRLKEEALLKEQRENELRQKKQQEEEERRIQAKIERDKIVYSSVDSTIYNCVDKSKLLGCLLDFVLYNKTPASLKTHISATKTSRATSIPLIAKNYHKELGKVLCVSGSIISIQDMSKTWIGQILTWDYKPVSVVALEDSESLIEGSSVSFCGIVYGFEEYEARNNNHLTQPQIVGFVQK